MKEGVNIVKITKAEVKFLSNSGVRFKDGGISKTNSCHRKRHTYYLCENKKNMSLLNQFRRNIVIK